MNARTITNADVNAIALLNTAPKQETAPIEHTAAFSSNDLQLHFETCIIPGILITHVQGTANANSLFNADDPEASVSMNFQLKGAVSSNHFAYGRSFNIYAAQHNLLYAKYGAGTHTFLKGNMQALHFRFDISYFNNLFAEEELMHGLLEKTVHADAFLANAAMMPIVPDMTAALNAIVHCPLKGQFKKVYLEGKILELLALQLSQAVHYKPPANSLCAADLRKIQEVKDYLDIHFLMPLSLLQLAKGFGLNDYKLKKGFRDIYRITVFSYIHQKRMSLALKLLSEKAATVGEVADTIGYNNSNHFSTAFKKFFGYSPGSVK